MWPLLNLEKKKWETLSYIVHAQHRLPGLAYKILKLGVCITILVESVYVGLPFMNKIIIYKFQAGGKNRLTR